MQPLGASPSASPPSESNGQAADEAWLIVRAAAAAAEHAASSQPADFALTDEGCLAPAAELRRPGVLAWRPETGWECLLPDRDERRALIDLYLPVCSATAAAPITVGHLGESLDGFIATHTGDSQWVTGPENVVHMHRLRALCDAVVVGAGTVAADDPQLTTRLVRGPNPLRVVIDPGRGLRADHRVFVDDSAETLYFCARDLVSEEDRHIGCAAIVGVTGDPDSLDVGEVMRLLRRRGCTRVFVEGGGVTVSAFLEADLLDRLHLAIAPLLIGDGRAAIRLPAPAALGDCHRPRYRVFRMGGDVLFDCDLRTRQEEPPADLPSAAVSRII